MIDSRIIERFQPSTRPRFNTSPTKKLSNRDVLTLAFCLVVTRMGMPRVGAMYARQVFERLAGGRWRMDMALRSICDKNGWHRNTLNRFYKFYSRLSEAVHGGKAKPKWIYGAIVAIFIFATEVKR